MNNISVFLSVFKHAALSTGSPYNSNIGPIFIFNIGQELFRYLVLILVRNSPYNSNIGQVLFRYLVLILVRNCSDI